MAAKTYNQHKEFFEEIADKHFQIHSFGMGEEHEINGAAEADRKYVKMWVIPIDKITRENTIERTFEFLIFDLVQKDESNEDEVISDTDQILHDVIKILHNESDDFDVINEPQAFPFTEKYADDVSGHRAQVIIQTDRANNYCDVPTDEIDI